MRNTLISRLITALLMPIALPVMAFEIEQETLFPAETPTARLNILSTADTDLFMPLILAFQDQAPGVEVNYVSANSSQVMKAIAEAGATFDIAISSAMDLQIKLANDGFTRPHQSEATSGLPDWARWRDQVFAFTQEPATVVVYPDAFDGLTLPRTRQDLITLLRNHPDRFRGRVGTYDIRSSGLGYLFATQDARTSDTYWRLTEVMGGLDVQLYCCSSDMIEDVSAGRIAVAYNVLGSYADARDDLSDRIHIIAPDDFTTLMLRSVLIPATAENPEDAAGFIDFLLTAAWGEGETTFYPFPRIVTAEDRGDAALRPIQMDPGLLVFLDRLKRDRFLQEWEDAIIQP